MYDLVLKTKDMINELVSDRSFSIITVAETVISLKDYGHK